MKKKAGRPKIAREYNTPLAILLKELGEEPVRVAIMTAVHPASLYRYMEGLRTPRLSTARNICAYLSQRLGREVTLDSVFPE